MMTDEPGARPEISIVLLVYEHEPFVSAAVRSILNQDCAPAEILICDDASSDQSYDVVWDECERYSGPHRVRHWQNARNIGVGNMHTILPRTKGEVVIVAHGDDIALPHRARRLAETLRETGAAIVSSNATIIDKAGREGATLISGRADGRIAPMDVLGGWSRWHLGATHGFRRAVFEAFPPWKPKRFWASTDLVFPFRADLLGGCHYLSEPLVKWRQHDQNLGKQVSWTSDSGDRSREYRKAYRAIAHLSMREDLAYFVEQRGETDQTRAMQEALDKTLFETLSAWKDARSRLLHADLRPVWLPKREAAKTVSPPGDVASE